MILTAIPALPRLVLLFLLLPAAAAVADARGDFERKAANPFDNNQDGLPDLGMAPESGEWEKNLAGMAKSFGEASMVDNGLGAGEQAKAFAFDQLRETLSQQVSRDLESWFSPWGNASIDLLVDDEGNFSGSHGSWFVPLQDNQRYLSWSQVGVTRRADGTVGNAGIGQRWIAGDWLLGYNTFYDSWIDEHIARGGLGAEAWGEYLRLSANYYEPLGGWRSSSVLREQRMARGYDLTALAWLPFYRHVNTSVSFEHYFGDSVDLFDSGTGYHNPTAVSLGLNYTPVPIVTLTAQHKQGENGVSQNNLGLKLNYRFGVPLKKQLEASEVASSKSLRGSRYDSPQRNMLPVMATRQRKNLSVFLATPPWDLQPGESVALKLQLRSSSGVRSLEWEGDSQALSLTPPANPRDREGWTIIMPAWDESPGATNRWHLRVTVEDEKGQRVSSNEIELALTAPLISWSEDDPRWQLLPATD